jgi:hypothetical protein
MWDNDKGRQIALFVKMAHLTYRYFDKLTIAPQDHPPQASHGDNGHYWIDRNPFMNSRNLEFPFAHGVC